MKKYLITGIAALAMCIGFTSCSHDLTPVSQEDVNAVNAKQIVDKYNSAFIAKFGQPAANQDWGFGNNAATRAFTRAGGKYATKGDLKPKNVTFPDDCDASKFNPDLTNVLSYDAYCKTLGNANWTPDEFACGEVYIDKVQKIHIWGEYGKRAKLYLKAGTYDFTNETFDLCADADLYLLSGATLTLNNTAASTAKFDVYIAEGAQLIANGQDGYRADVDAHVYNHGTITCPRFEVNGTSFLYNVGKLKSSGDVYIANSTSRIVNDGDIESVSVHVEGSGALQNNAEWTVTGNTIVNCTDGGWVNNGYWKTQNYGYTAGSENVINNCFLEVTEEFDMNISSSNSNASFKIDTGGGVLTKNFYGGKVIGDTSPQPSGPYKIVMGHSAVFKVTGTATLEGGNPGWGFFGPADGDYAVFQAKNVVRNERLKNTQGAVTYSGNLYVSAETHFGKGTDYDTYIYEQGGFSVDVNIYAAGFHPGKPGVTIQQTSCCPGFEGDEEDEFDVRIIGEDLTPGDTDWDFNDAVFDVAFMTSTEWINNSSVTKITDTIITLWAAGGTKKLYVGGKEVHELFGQPVTTMINTNADGGVDGLTPVIFRVSNPAEPNANLIPVYVNNIELTAKQGEATQKFEVPNTTRWMKERKIITGTYTKFQEYVRNNDPLDWYKTIANEGDLY